MERGQQLVADLESVLSDVEAKLPKNFPQRIWTPISQGMLGQAKKFMSGAAGFS